MSRPGTVATINPPPPFVAKARHLIESGTTRAEAIKALAADADGQAEALTEAVEWWVRRVPRHRWDDYSAGHVLGALEGALSTVEPLTSSR